MIRSLFASASGLRAHQEMLDVVGNNLANVSTPGFKSQRLRFASEFSQVLGAQSAPTDSGGGQNPIEIGLGVQAAATDTLFSQGTYESTGNKFDLGIQDAGFFVVRSDNEFLYTRAGAFSVDADSFLVDSATGHRVQRLGTVGEGSATAPTFQVSGNNDIRIPRGITIPGNATQNISFRGNLDAHADGPVATALLSGQPLTTGGLPANDSTHLNDLDQTLAPYVAGDQIRITGTRVDGSAVSTVFTAAGTAADTLGALRNVINTAYLSATPGLGATATLDGNGNLVMTANQPGPSSLTLALSGDPNDGNLTSGITEFRDFRRTVEGKAGSTATTVMEVFDDQFTAHNVTFTFQKVAANEWNLRTALDADVGTITKYGEDDSVAGLRFNENGSLLGLFGSGTAQTMALGSPLTVGGAPATTATPLGQLDQHSLAAYSAGDVLTISGSEHDGQSIAPVNFSPEGMTIGDLLASINSAFSTASAALDASGNIVLSSATTGQSELSLRLEDAATNAGRTSFGSFTEAIRGHDGDDTITFQINGLAGFGTKQTIQLSFGASNGFDGMTQFGSFTSAAAVKQDGFSQGTLIDENVQSDGTILGQFSNGRTEPLAQLALATFANPQGLERAGNNYFGATASAGPAIVTAARSGAAGSIQSGVLESSNVDVGIEFTQLISAQRGFQVNARAFSIGNQILEETANLLR